MEWRIVTCIILKRIANFQKQPLLYKKSECGVALVVYS